MSTNLTVEIEDRPGALASVGESVRDAGVNLEAVSCARVGELGVCHLAIDDAAVATARSALQQAGLTVREEQPVLVVDVEDRPGALGDVARRCAEADVNLNLVYVATSTRLVLGVDDLDAARRLF